MICRNAHSQKVHSLIKPRAWKQDWVLELFKIFHLTLQCFPIGFCSHRNEPLSVHTVCACPHDGYYDSAYDILVVRKREELWGRECAYDYCSSPWQPCIAQALKMDRTKSYLQQPWNVTGGDCFDWMAWFLCIAKTTRRNKPNSWISLRFDSCV